MSDFLGGIFAALMALLPGGAGDAGGYPGYLEADYVYVAPVGAGRLVDVTVTEGEPVGLGDLLFAQDDAQQQALLKAALARRQSAEANLDNLTTGSRALEVDVIRASLAKARSDLALAQSNLARSEKLLAAGTTTQARVEQDRAALASAQAQVAQFTAQVGVAELPARNAQQVAAEAELEAAAADANRAQLDLRDRQTTAPVAGIVDRLFYSAGEIATAGTPVVSILPAGALKARFFVPEADRSALAVGGMVQVGCDGCTAMSARITYFASEPQTTPPVIYSKEERGRLVYLVEAELEAPGGLRPGQPVTVTR
ncbi:HlyD family secretion protein [Devosia sp. ZW T5_3]|uniref:HlyD family secretion protein n=1 Tax=Devosia sp. ZW T5_3 TaxID=3378085 RepID=UPI003851D9A7